MSRVTSVVRRVVRIDVLSLLAGALLWELIGRSGDGEKLPPFSEVVSAAWRMLLDGEFDTTLSTMGLFGAGVLLSIVLAVLTAALISALPFVGQLVKPYLFVFLALPPLALVPIFMLLWGPTDGARVAVVLTFAYFPLAVLFSAAVEDAPPENVEMARSFGASPLRTFFRVRVPAVAGRLVAGTRLGVVRGLKGSITAEAVMGGVGLGGLLRTFGAGFQLVELYATVLVVMVLSVVIYTAVRTAERYVERSMG